MTDELTHDEVARMVRQVLDDLDKEACRTCDCLQGYLVQLELDASGDVSDIVDPLKVARDAMHGCLGCDPCVPGAHFARYLKGKTES